MHGLGNDFVIFDDAQFLPNLTPQVIAKICDRHIGVGCDQLIYVEKATDAGQDWDLEMKIFNADSSVAQMCGNGARCVIGLFDAQHLGVIRLKSGDRILACWHQGSLVSINMGAASVDLNPLNFEIAGEKFQGFKVDVGNPHLIIFDLQSPESAEAIGTMLQGHPEFPSGVNVNFAKITAPDLIELKVWERGVGFTHACGSGATATFAAALKSNLVAPMAKIKFKYGELEMLEAENRTYVMSGCYELVFRGSLDFGLL